MNINIKWYKQIFYIVTFATQTNKKLTRHVSISELPTSNINIEHQQINKKNAISQDIEMINFPNEADNFLRVFTYALRCKCVWCTITYPGGIENFIVKLCRAQR